MKYTSQLINVCLMILFFSGCDSVDPFKQAIKGSAITPLTEQEKKELANHGDQPITQLTAEDKKAVAEILAKHLSDPKKLNKQLCHLLSLGMPSKQECLEARKECLAEVDKMDGKAFVEERKSKFENLPASPQLIVKLFEKLALFLGSDELVNTDCGGNIKNLEARVRALPQELGLSEDEFKQIFASMGDMGQPNTTENASQSEEFFTQLKVQMDSNVGATIAEFKAGARAAELQAFKALSRDDIKNSPEYKEMLQGLNESFAKLAEQGIRIDDAKVQQILLDFFQKVQAGL